RNVDLGSLRLDEHAFEIRVDEVRTPERIADVREGSRRIGTALDVDVADDQHRHRVRTEGAAPSPGRLCCREHREYRRDGENEDEATRPAHENPPSTSIAYSLSRGAAVYNAIVSVSDLHRNLRDMLAEAERAASAGDFGLAEGLLKDAAQLQE